jgi:hypothetical protein
MTLDKFVTRYKQLWDEFVELDNRLGTKPNTTADFDRYNELWQQLISLRKELDSN